MKTVVVIARSLLGIIFVVFGLNGFLHFLPQPEMPPAAGAFFGGLAASGFMLPTIFATQVVGGALLLLGMVPLAVLILAPVILVIVEFHVLLAPAGLPLAIVVAALAVAHRSAYRPLFAALQWSSLRTQVVDERATSFKVTNPTAQGRFPADRMSARLTAP